MRLIIAANGVFFSSTNSRWYSTHRIDLLDLNVAADIAGLVDFSRKLSQTSIVVAPGLLQKGLLLFHITEASVKAR